MSLLRLILLLAAGAALSLAFPAPSLWPIAWVGLVPLLIYVRKCRTSTAALRGLMFGLGYFGALLYWIIIFGKAPWVLLAVMQALFIALFAVVARFVYSTRRSWLQFIAIPAAWTAVEWLRSLGTFGFTWGDLAYSQANNLPVIQIVSITGPWGVSFLIAAVSTAFAADKKCRVGQLAAAAVVVAIVSVFGFISLRERPSDREKLPVAVVQGSLDQDVQQTREMMLNTARTYTRLTTDAASLGPSVIVWPETVVPGNISTSPDIREWVSSIAANSQTHLLTGALDERYATAKSPASARNGAYMFGPDGRLLGTYYKVHLVPFGEFVPGRELMPFVADYGVRPVDVSPGKEHNLLQTEYGKTGVMICFESTFASIGRLETKKGARLLFVITNDGWFGKTWAAPQHQDFAVFRAIENGRYVVRSAATGISSIVDPYGRVQDRLGMWRQGVLYGEVEMRSGLTPYARFGDWFVYLCLGIIGLVVGVFSYEFRVPSSE